MEHGTQLFVNREEYLKFVVLHMLDVLCFCTDHALTDKGMLLAEMKYCKRYAHLYTAFSYRPILYPQVRIACKYVGQLCFSCMCTFVPFPLSCWPWKTCASVELFSKFKL